jgi:hypothetical protein
MENEKKSSASNTESLTGSVGNLIAGSDQNAIRKAFTDKEPTLPYYLHLGMVFSNFVEKIIALYTAEHGDTVPNRRLVSDAVYSHIEAEYGRKRTSVRLYIRCYQRFKDWPDGATLTFREMLLRLGDSNTGSAA